MLKLWLSFWFFLFTLACTHFSLAEEAVPLPALASVKPIWTAHVLRRKPEDRKITGFSVLADELPVMLVPKENKLRPFTEIPILFDHPGWILFAQEQQVTEKSDGASKLKIPIYLNGRVNQVTLNAKGPDGESESETVYIVSPNAQEFAVVNPWDRVLVSVGMTNLNYFQTYYGTYTSTTGLVGVQYATPPETAYGFYSSMDITALTFDESPIKAGVEIVEAKADFALALKQNRLTSPWRHQLLAGASFLTMYANSAPFGFANLLAPEIGLRSRYIKNSKDAYIVDMRYIALDKPTDLSQGGINLSLAFSRILPSFHRIEPSFNYSRYFFTPETGKSVRVEVISLRIAYSL